MPGSVTITIDGKAVTANAGDLVIKVAQEHGVYIPRFCWHERMKPVGMCRMCLVEIEGQRGLPPACTATVADGMVVHTDTPTVKKAQEGVLEFLLINHPLDCPVCDRGGECPLQDVTFGYGPAESRFIEEKRHFAKPLPISDLVLLDRERCILCARCTRFADEVAGDPLISFVDRGGHSQVLTFPTEPFASYFSGNTVQICPVGALLAAPYRFRARPWDLSSVESSCTFCSTGCRVELQSSTNRMVRVLGVDSEPVNHGWLCDKGRFGFDFIHHESRFTAPRVRGADGSSVESTWPEALDAAAAGLKAALSAGGPESVAVLGGARGTNEDAYAWARLAKGVLRTDNVDAQLGDGLPAEVVLGLERATIADCDTARAIVLVGPDLKEELPVLYLRVRRAAVDLGVTLVEIGAASTGLSRYARHRIPAGPGELAAAATALVAGGGTDVSDLLHRADGHLVVIGGRPSMADGGDDAAAAITALAALPGARLLSALRRGNVHGALDLGLAPGLLPGRVALDAGREWFAAAWGTVPDAAGLDAAGILTAAAEGRIGALVLLGADPLSSFPNQDLARAALQQTKFVVAVDAFPTASNAFASVVLPVATAAEERGSATNLEGRIQRLARKVTPPGTAMEDWRIAVELAARLGSDFDLEAVDEVTDEIAALASAYAGCDAALLRRVADGVVVPHNPDGPPGESATVESATVDSAAVESLTGESLTARSPSVPTGMSRPTLVGPPSPPGPGPVPQAPEASGGGTRNGRGYRLLSGRRLYDTGVVVTHSEALAKLPVAPAARISPGDAQRLGLNAGAAVTLTGDRGTLSLEVEIDNRIVDGVIYVPFNAPGGGAEVLVGSGALTEVSVDG